MIVTAAQWLVLDNLAHGWKYHANLTKNQADEAYGWAIRNGFAKDGKLTPAGEGVVMTMRAEVKEQP